MFVYASDMVTIYCIIVYQQALWPEVDEWRLDVSVYQRHRVPFYFFSLVLVLLLRRMREGGREGGRE